jgi:hypothetical protein
MRIERNATVDRRLARLRNGALLAELHAERRATPRRRSAVPSAEYVTDRLPCPYCGHRIRARDYGQRAWVCSRCRRPWLFEG